MSQLIVRSAPQPKRRMFPSLFFIACFLCFTPASFAEDSWTAPATLFAGGFYPDVVSDGLDHFVSAWHLGNIVYFSRSANGGNTWSVPGIINDDTSVDHQNVRLATDKQGNFVAVYMYAGTGQIHAARSTDHGNTWQPHVIIGAGLWPQIATDGNGQWVEAHTNGALPSSIVVTRSNDNGMTWGSPIPIAPGDGFGPNIATDRNGKWILIWTYLNSLYEAASVNGGASWSTPKIIGPGYGYGWGPGPSLDTNELDKWIVSTPAPHAETCYSNSTIALYSSTDNGDMWQPLSYPFHAVNNCAQYTDEYLPQISSDKGGSWQLSYTSRTWNTATNDYINHSINIARYEESTGQWDNGVTALPGGIDDIPFPAGQVNSVLSNDGFGQWVCMWDFIKDPFGFSTIKYSLLDDFTTAPVIRDLALTASPAFAGSISASPPPGPSNGYADGTVVTLTAHPTAGFVLGSWSGDASGNANPIQVTMNSDKQVTANFVSGSLPDLIVSWQNYGLVNGRFSSNLTIQYTVSNVGATDAASTKLTFYAAPDQTIGPQSFPLRTVPVGLLRAGRTLQRRITIRLATPISGSFVIGQIDSNHEVTELDENNNTFVFGPLP